MATKKQLADKQKTIETFDKIIASVRVIPMTAGYLVKYGDMQLAFSSLNEVMNYVKDSFEPAIYENAREKREIIIESRINNE